ncbi:hypothetical protein D3C83_318800 [compost metagenome]
MAREADEADLAGFLGGFEGFDRAAGGEDGFEVLVGSDGVNLPQIEVVGLEVF